MEKSSLPNHTRMYIAMVPAFVYVPDGHHRKRLEEGLIIRKGEPLFFVNAFPSLGTLVADAVLFARLL